ncbi:hypothetical protein BDF20DRAFT_832853 [Mycotypha africana]|uniref:uncharacterized protein n=1 Tax=Mycotypha africana TaxID=64632 RepID=UPI0023004306|nr:uncharacterized protein BDF20DRAFT_832853 [Mycotypha africana]KAI8987967.1 hypothetical protein BDF20DRAFT_832853 [Mycotypha africana]
MRPDEHKVKDSHRYQQKKKLAGDSSAAEIALARRKKNAAARDRGMGVAAIRRRNGEFVEETEEEKAERRYQQAKYSKRTMLSTNADRYTEVDELEEMKRDAEMGIDRETTDLVSMLQDSSAAELENTSSTMFKFKDEKLLDDNMTLSKQRNTMFELDFDTFNTALNDFDAAALLGLNHDASDNELLDNALNEHPIVVDKPIVPPFSTNAKGYIMFKSQQYQQPPTSNYRVSEKDGIYLRNNTSMNISNKVSMANTPDTSIPNQKLNPKAQFSERQQQQSFDANKDDDALDDLLALDQTKIPTTTLATAVPKSNSLPSPTISSVEKPTKKTLPKPGQIKKPLQQAPSVSSTAVSQDDEAWLDELLG